MYHQIWRGDAPPAFGYPEQGVSARRLKGVD